MEYIEIFTQYTICNVKLCHPKYLNLLLNMGKVEEKT